MTYKITLPIPSCEFNRSFRIIISSIVVWMLYLSVAFAQFPTGWQHKQKILIQNPGAAKTDDFQISVNINTKELVLAGKMRTDGNDIRFARKCDGTVELDYYIDSGINKSNTLIWVNIKTPDLKAGADSIFIFYGKSDATAKSNRDLTFPNSKIVTMSETILKGTNSWNFDWIEIQAGSTVTLAPDHDSIFVLNARKILISGTLNGNFTGYSDLDGSRGPGAGGKGLNLTGGGGGSYGGSGGQGGASSGNTTPGTGGLLYGTNCAYDIDMGSAGGNGNPDPTVVGSGGGAFILKGNSIVINNGTITVDGDSAPASAFAGGGGSGGGILIHGKGITLKGTLSAKGGKGGNKTAGVPQGGAGGGGGGGRVKVFYLDDYNTTATKSLTGGAGGTGSNPAGVAGSPGTFCETGNYPTAEPLTQLKSLAPTVDITATDEDICVGESVTFTATVTNGGASPGYSWKLNTDANTVSTSSTYTSSGLADNDKVYCIITSNSTCVSPSQARSDTIIMNVSSSITPSCEIMVDKQMPVCPGTEVTFTATNNNGGSTPTYKWMVNGTENGALGDTYTTSTLSNNNVVSCKMEVSVDMTCANPSTVESNQIVMKVEYRLPTIKVSVQNDSICPDSTARFTSQITFGGNAPQYQWQVDQQEVPGATGPSYNTDALNSGDKVRCRMVSNDPCAEPDTAFSNEVAMYIGTIQPSVNIEADNTTVCSNGGYGTATFTAYTQHTGGACVQYKWKKVGTTQSASDDNVHEQGNILDGDCFYCEMTSCLSCSSGPVYSDTICITVVSALTPYVDISVSPNDTVCSGDSVKFTAEPFYNGNHTYEWWRKGTPDVLIAASTSKSYAMKAVDNDIIYCNLQVDPAMTGCTNPDAAKSNEITIRFATEPVVSVSIDGDSAICKGDLASFTASPVNGGVAPVYRWYINSTKQESDSAETFQTNALNDNDTVWCEVISDLACASKTPASSNRIAVKVREISNVDFKHEEMVDSVGYEFTFIIKDGKGPDRTYHWNFDDPGSPDNEAFGDSAKHTFAKGHDHNVTLSITTTDSVCTNKKSIMVLVKTGITQYNSGSLTLSPNPNNGEFMLELNDNSSITAIEVLDIRGKLIYKQGAVQGNKQRIVLPEPGKGLYIIKIITRNKIITAKTLIH